MSILSDTAKAASLGDQQGLKDVLDFLVTEEQLGVTFVSAASRTLRGPRRKRSCRCCRTP